MTSECDLWLIYHVPKTGGQTLRNHLRERLGADRHIHLGRWEPDSPRLTRDVFEAMPHAQRSRISVITGHQVERSLREYFPGRRLREVLVVREPVDRIISHYHFSVSRQVQRNEEPETFSRFLDRVGSNPMTRWVSGFFGEQRHRRALDSALYGLQRCTVVWPLEELDSIIGRLLRAMGLDAAIPERANVRGKVSPPQLELDAGELARIAERNDQDATLYRVALRYRESTIRNVSELVQAGGGR